MIGADTATAPVTSGYGSSRVLPPFTSSPLEAIRHRAGRHATVTYAAGGSTTGRLPPVPPHYLTPASGSGHGLTFTVTQTDPDSAGPVSLHTVQPTVDVSLSPHPTNSGLPTGAPLGAPVERLHNPLIGSGDLLHLGGSASPERTHVILPPGWSGGVSAEWTGTLTPPRTGLYTFSLQGVGAATLTLDGVTAVSDPLSHALGRWAQTVSLAAGHPYRVALSWEPIDHRTPSGETSVTASWLTLGWAYVSGDIRTAVAAARPRRRGGGLCRRLQLGGIRPALALPARRQGHASSRRWPPPTPHTVVVLNTGGPVLMPWLARVQGVMEAWYPGEQDGASIAALLYGDVDPSGRLPVTFPASNAATGVDTAAQWPGVDLTSTYSEGLEVGYRYDHAAGVEPLFPFGYGLAYTRFALARLTLMRRPTASACGSGSPNAGAGPVSLSPRPTSPIRRRPASRPASWWPSDRWSWLPVSPGCSPWTSRRRHSGSTWATGGPPYRAPTPWRWARTRPTCRWPSR